MKKRFVIGLICLVSAGLVMSCASQSGKKGEIQEGSLSQETDDDALLEGLNTQQQKSSPKELESKYAKIAQALRTKSEQQLLDAASLILFEDPDDVRTLNALALFYINRGKLGLAKQYLARALKKGSGESAVQNNLGIVLGAEGHQDDAIAAFKKAINIDSGNVAAATNLGLIYAKYGAYGKALPLLERAHEANKNDANVALAYAVTLRGTNNPSDAARIYKSLVGSTDDVAMLMDYAEMLAYELKSESEARTVLNKIRFLDPRGEIVDRVIQLERQLK
jgi:Flp pilus assembly protein TadD